MPLKSCKHCGSKLIRRPTEKASAFALRKFCSQKCWGASRVSSVQHLFDRAIPEPNTGCLLWLGAVNRDGYGICSFGRNSGLVTRLLYEKIFRPLAAGECVCHSCDVRSCINPDHLWAGSHQENMADKVSKGRSVGIGMPGEYNPSAKLTAAQVLQIVDLSHGHFQQEIADMFSVQRQTVGDIISGRRWSSVTGIRRRAA